MRSDRFDTSWFDLKKYEKLSELDLMGWCSQLEFRQYVNDHGSDDDNKDYVENWLRRIKQKPILESYVDDRQKTQQELYPFNTYSVWSLSAMEAWGGGTDSRLDYVWQACEMENAYIPTKEQARLVQTPIDFLFKANGIDKDIYMFNHVVVDLEATDAQIMRDFRHWLTEYRKAIGYESSKKSFTETNLSEWMSNKLLPYIDLTLTAKLERKSITQAEIARLIFPDESNIDLVERLRRTIKPKAEWLIKAATVAAINAQARAT